MQSNNVKRVSHKITSVDAENIFVKVRHPHMIRTLSKLEVEGIS